MSLYRGITSDFFSQFLMEFLYINQTDGTSHSVASQLGQNCLYLSKKGVIQFKKIMLRKGYEMLSSIYGDIQARAIARSRQRTSVLTRNGSIIPKPVTDGKKVGASCSKLCLLNAVIKPSICELYIDFKSKYTGIFC